MVTHYNQQLLFWEKGTSILGVRFRGRCRIASHHEDRLPAILCGSACVSGMMGGTFHHSRFPIRQRYGQDPMGVGVVKAA
jgi:hypothetical protein